MRYFRNKESETCHSEAYFQELMKENGLTQVEVYKAEAIKNSMDALGYFYCTHFQAMGTKGCCGKICDEYSPRNGKSGCCRHVGRMYWIGETVTLHLKI